jgi:four helix bundle protein
MNPSIASGSNSVSARVSPTGTKCAPTKVGEPDGVAPFPCLRPPTSDFRPPMQIKSAKDLDVYRTAYALAMRIFDFSKTFPAEEKFALTSQIRRSSRSVCLNLREAWAKRRYEAHFISKLTDCDGENAETDSSLDFARDCRYISDAQHDELVALNREVGRMLGSMIKNPSPFLPLTSDL